jgi:hypothetical protein
VGHRSGDAGGSLLGDPGVRTGPAAVDGVVEDLEPLVKQLRGERIALVERSMGLDHIDLVVGCVEDDVAPVVGNGLGVGLPVDEPGAEVK